MVPPSVGRADRADRAVSECGAIFAWMLAHQRQRIEVRLLNGIEAKLSSIPVAEERDGVFA